MTDSTQFLVNNVAGALGGQTIQTRYEDIINPPKETSDADAEEIKERILSGLRELGEE